METIAMYLRLSLEDKYQGMDESNSITNQRTLIKDYIQRNEKLCRYHVKEFCDDGYSGTNMERPGVSRLVKEVKENRITCIIVKDMSRFSRDYIELGTYLNQIFPFMGIRFIAINDHYDSLEHEGATIELDTAFKTLLYDLYSKDVSIKIKASFKNKSENGEYVFGQVPFGYEKSKTRKNKVLVCEKEAQVVRYIISLAMQGMSTPQISKRLYEEKIPTISQMRYPGRTTEVGKTVTWTSSAIRKIINNRFYLGEMQSGKTMRKSVGSKNGIMLPPEKWHTIPNHHEALMTEEEFMIVSKPKRDVSTKRKGRKNLLVGKLYCGGCGYSMIYKPIRKSNKYRRFECRMHAQLQIADCCTYFPADILEELVYSSIIKELVERANAMEQKEDVDSFQKSKMASLKKKLSDCRNSKKELQTEKSCMYKQYVEGAMTAEEYQKRIAEAGKQYELLSVSEKELQEQLSYINAEYRCQKDDMKQVIRCLQMEELTQEMMDCFIKRIYVSRGRQVRIEWNFTR